MKLETAQKIILEQAKYLETIYEYGLDKDDEDKLSYDGGIVEEYAIHSKYREELIDFSKIHVTIADNYGGEGMGDTYYYVFKIEHPEHGVAYLKYEGNYDSWNGTDWYEGNAHFVVPKQITKTIYVAE